ncbi:MAG: hypothetical protein ACE5F9_08750 [Phycisphaerae bacterium]
MSKFERRIGTTAMFVAGLASLGFAARATAQSNVDSTNKFAWGENIGWANWLDAGAGADGVLVGPTFMSGFIWGENVGWINLDDATRFVSVDAATTPTVCDMNHDGLVDGLDIQLFTDFLLLSSPPDWRDVCSGDVETTPDGTIDLADVANFVACLLI